MATTTKPWSEPTVGILTLGTGTASENSQRSQGSLNVSGSPNFGNDTDAALVYALSRAKHVHILGGKFPAFSTSVAIPDGAIITAEPSAILQPAVSGAVGLFTIAGAARLSGFAIEVSTFVASQELIQGTSAKDIRISDIKFTVATSSAPSALAPTEPVGDESTPMIGIHLDGCTRAYIERCVFLPSFAFECIQLESCSAYNVNWNQFTTDVDSGLGTVNPGGSVTTLSNPRLMYRGIHLLGSEWGNVVGNRFWNLGDNNGAFALWGTNALTLTLASNNIAHTMARPPKPGTLYVSITHAGGSGVMRDDGAGALTFFSGTASAITTATIDYETGELAINLADNITAATATTWHLVHSCILINSTAAATVDEQGHSLIAFNQIEQVSTPRAIALWGANSMRVFGNLIGYLGGGPAVEGEAGVVIAGKDGNDAVNLSYGIQLVANDLHNCGKVSTLGSFVYAKQVDGLFMRANRLAVQSSTYSLILAASCVAPTIIANHFEALTSATNAIRLLAGQLTKGIAIGGNTSLKITTLVSDASDAGAAGRRKVLRGIQNSTTGNDITTSDDLALATTNIKLDV